MQNTQQVIFACLAGIALLPGSASCHEPTVNVLIDILRDKKAPSSALAAFESFVRTLFLAVNSNPEIGIALAIQNRNAIGFHGVLVGVTLKLHCFLFLLFLKTHHQEFQAVCLSFKMLSIWRLLFPDMVQAHSVLQP